MNVRQTRIDDDFVINEKLKRNHLIENVQSPQTQRRFDDFLRARFVNT